MSLHSSDNPNPPRTTHGKSSESPVSSDRDPQTCRKSESSRSTHSHRSRLSESGSSDAHEHEMAPVPPRPTRDAHQQSRGAGHEHADAMSEEQMQLERLREFSMQVGEVAARVFVSGYDVAKDRELLKSKVCAYNDDVI